MADYSPFQVPEEFVSRIQSDSVGDFDNSANLILVKYYHLLEIEYFS